MISDWISLVESPGLWRNHSHTVFQLAMPDKTTVVPRSPEKEAVRLKDRYWSDQRREFEGGDA